MVIMFSFFLAETLQKITALESELARLKAQIAVYALSEPKMSRTSQRVHCHTLFNDSYVILELLLSSN